MIVSKTSDLRCRECDSTDVSIRFILDKDLRAIRMRVDCNRHGGFSHFADCSKAVELLSAKVSEDLI